MVMCVCINNQRVCWNDHQMMTAKAREKTLHSAVADLSPEGEKGREDLVIEWLVGGWAYPSEKYESQLGWLFPIDGKIKNVPNHQPDKI